MAYERSRLGVHRMARADGGAARMEEVTRVHGAGELARVYPRYGYRRIQVFLERDGHAMSAGAGHAIKAPLLRSPGHSGAERAVARVLRQCRWGFAEKGSPGTVPMT